MLRDFLISLSFANICLSNIWLRFFYRSKLSMKYLPTANSFLALIINEILFTLGIWGGLWLIRRLNNKIISKVVKILVCLMVLAFINAFANSFPGMFDEKNFNLILLTVILFLLWKQAMTKATIVFVLLMAPFVLVILGQSAQGIANGNHDNHSAVISNPIEASNPPSTPRILWLIFDEMDYRISFVDRPKHIRLPEFDRFKRQSLSAENAYSPAGSTVPSITALTTGKLMSGASLFDSDTLNVTFEGSNQEVNWGDLPNVFTKAKTLGVNTALIGEYIPYTQLIGDDLDYCAWSAYRFQYVSSKDTLWDNLTTQIYGFFNVLKLHSEQHKIATREVFDGARNLIGDSRYGLVFIHLPVPHPPYIYKHAWWDQFVNGYAENLVLTDKIFGQFRKDMENQGVWDNTNIIVSSDHWFGKCQKFDGKEDHRVPFMVKLANHEKPVVYQREFNTVITHDLVLDILNKKVTTPDELVSWLNIRID